MKPLVNVLPVQSLGRRRSIAAFVTLAGGRDGGMRDVELNAYPHSPRGEELRQVRCGSGRMVGLGELSRALGIAAEQLSGLESGRYTLSDADWDVAIRVAREKAGEP